MLKNVPSTVRFSYLSSIEVDLFFDCTGTDWTEVITGERVHQAIVARTVNTLGHVTTSFIGSEFLGILGIVGSGNGSIFIKHIFPFLIKVCQCGKIGLPRFHVGRVHIVVATADFHVFVSKAEKQVSELVNINLGRMEVTGNADAVMVINGSTTIFLRVSNNVDEVVGDVSG